MTQQTEESLLSRIQRTVVMQAATGGMANGIDAAMAGAHGVDVTGLNGANMGDGSILHHGPQEGGAALDRPSAGYMAHASMHEGITVEPQGEGISTVARGIDDAATMTIDGQTIQVLDYMPGGDMIQMAAGHADPGQMLMRLAEHGVVQEVEKGITNGLSMGHPAAGRLDMERGHQDGANDEHALSKEAAGGHDDERGDISESPRDSEAATTRHRSGQHVPDADENARDLEALSFQHRLDVDTAIETSDTAHVHTQIHAHGRTLELDTDFEATKPSNEEERAEASDHVNEVSRGGHDEVNLDEPGMHIRSRIAAHLDAASRDDGISM